MKPTIKPIPKKMNKREIMKEIAQLIDIVGFDEINKTELAERYGKTRQTIYNYIAQLEKNCSLVDVEKIGIDLKKTFSKTMRRNREILLASKFDPKKRLNESGQIFEASRVLNQTADSYTKFLERFAYKPRVAEEINLHGDAVEVKVFRIDEFEYNEKIKKAQVKEDRKKKMRRKKVGGHAGVKKKGKKSK